MASDSSLALPSRRPALLLSHLLSLWPLLLLPLPPPAQGSSSSPRTPPAPARPPCARGGPSAPRHVCVWERAPPPSRSPRVLRSRRQVLPGTAPPATPSGFEEGPPSSQYPWAIVWGPTVSREDGGDPNSANPGFLPLDYGFAAPHGLATPHPNSDSMRADGDGLILGEAPATLRPFLFGGRGEGEWEKLRRDMDGELVEDSQGSNRVLCISSCHKCAGPWAGTGGGKEDVSEPQRSSGPLVKTRKPSGMSQQ